MEAPGPAIESVTVTAATLPKGNGRIKSTVDLQNIFKPKPADEVAAEKIPDPANDRPVSADQLKAAMNAFADSRKEQAAEYQLLRRDFTFQDGTVTIALSNTIEEPLLQNIRLQLIAFLRDKLENSTISVVGVLQEAGAKKVVYTNKEKFDHLAEKNPALRELKERLGLDTDY